MQAERLLPGSAGVPPANKFRSSPNIRAARQRPPYQSINQDENGSILGGFHNILKLPVNRHRLFEFRGHIRHRFKETQEQTALHRIIHILRQRPAGRQRHRRIQFGRDDAHHVPVRLHQRAARIARLHRHADLEITRVIRRAGQRRDFPLASLGENPCIPMLGKPTVATVPPNFTVRLAAMGSGANRPTALSNTRSFAASTFTTVAAIKPAPVTNELLSHL